MQKLVLLLIALMVSSSAKIWDDAETFYYYAWFEDDSLDTYNYRAEEAQGVYFAEEAQGIYFYGTYGIDHDSMEVYREHAALLVRNDSIDAGDSIWISKYWMDDNLLDEPAVMDRNVDLDDFRPLTFDALHTDYDLWPLLDERAEKSERSSLFLLYRKDSSYYALCLLGYYPLVCDFYLSCQFQDDGTTNFEKIPDVEGIIFHGCPTSLPRPARRSSLGLQEGIPYQINGSRSRDNASSIVIQNGQPKLKLKK
jgi:hypothetical protein